MRIRSFLAAVAAAVLMVAVSAPQVDAQPSPPSASRPQAPPPYRLQAEDQVRVVVIDEPDLTIEQRIDDRGEVRLALHGPLLLAGLTAREAEQRIERAYIEARLLRQPQVTVTITGFRPRSALAFGELRTTGSIGFPPNVERLDIVEFITLAGGFTEVARQNPVTVVRLLPDGKEQTSEVDVGAMLNRRGGGERPEIFYVLPGDRVFVKTRVF